jgi:hypothetical protein
MTREKAIFAFVIDVVGAKKVGNLLKQFGYDGEPTPELCMQVLDREGKAFAVPFGELAKEAGKSPKAKAKLLAAAKLNKAAGQAGAAGTVAGTTTGTPMTAEQKSQQGLAWFNAIAGLFGTAINSVDDIANATNGTNANLALAQMEREERLREEAAQKTTLYWILGGIGILLVVVIFVVALTKRQ